MRRRLYVVLAVMTLLYSTVGSFYAQAVDVGGSAEWAHRASVIVTEPIGLSRANEPVELRLEHPSIMVGARDVRIVDSAGVEIPYQVSESNDQQHSYRISFLASASGHGTSDYAVYFGNPRAAKPSYPALATRLDNTAKTWSTGSVFLKWGGRSGFSNGNHVETFPLTKLRFDDPGTGHPENGLDRITTGTAWDTVYGWLGKDLIGNSPGGFGANDGSISNVGPIFVELRLGNAVIRSYKDNPNWIYTNGWPGNLFCPARAWKYLKTGLGKEMFIEDWGSYDIKSWLYGNPDLSINPGYMAFRDPSTDLIIGAIATGVPTWWISAKYSGGWDRVISFGDSHKYSSAKIYWYSDLSNGYEGIERFSKQVLNPLQVELIMDTEAPVTTLSTDPPGPDGFNGFFVTEPTVTLTPSEPSTTKYRWDDGAWQDYAGPFQAAEGRHALEYYSTDSYGNAEAVKSRVFEVDCTAPSPPTLLSPTDGAYIDGNNSIFSWNSSSDSGSGLRDYEVYLDGNPLAMVDGSETSAVTMFPIPEEEHTWFVRAYDKAGNSSDSSSWRLMVDRTPPAVHIYLDPGLKDLAVVGADNLSGSVAVAYTEEPLHGWRLLPLSGCNGWVKRSYRLEDEAGNTTSLPIAVLKEGQQLKAEVLGVGYGGREQGEVGANSLKFEWSADKSGALRSLNQGIWVEAEGHLQGRYDARKGRTTVKLSQGLFEEASVTKPGLALIGLNVEDGGLEFAY